MKIILSLLLFGWLTAQAELTPTGTLPHIILKNDLGGKVDGSNWDSATLKRKYHLLFYTDPDEKDLNDELVEALEKANFPDNTFTSVAIINMGATWLPDMAIAMMLKQKQKKYPDTIFVKDLKKTLVKQWKLKDDSVNVLYLNPQGEVIFYQDGKLSEQKIQQLLHLIRSDMM
jgi:uncharacterized protein